MKTTKKHIQLKPGARRTVILTLGFLCLLIFLLVQSKPAGLMQSGTTLSANEQVSSASIKGLTTKFTKEGIEGFSQHKALLKNDVRKALAGGNESANSLAVYLFPDLLDDRDFERTAAMGSWAPLQSLIEANPNSPLGRTHFEEMRGEIWVYENPDHRQPELSETASEVVNLYDAISRTQ